VTVRFVPVELVNQRFVDEIVPAVSHPVPVAFVNKKLVSVELEDQNCVVEAPATLNW